MCNFENILRFSYFSIALDMLRITHFLEEIMNPKNSASGNFLTFSMSAIYDRFYLLTQKLFWTKDFLWTKLIFDQNFCTQERIEPKSSWIQISFGSKKYLDLKILLDYFLIFLKVFWTLHFLELIFFPRKFLTQYLLYILFYAWS